MRFTGAMLRQMLWLAIDSKRCWHAISSQSSANGCSMKFKTYLVPAYALPRSSAFLLDVMAWQLWMPCVLLVLLYGVHVAESHVYGLMGGAWVGLLVPQLHGHAPSVQHEPDQ